jgi:hypothetical protein
MENDVTEEPAIFGEKGPFTLIHADDLSEVTAFLSARGVETKPAPGGPSLFRLQFSGMSGEDARTLMRELMRTRAGLGKEVGAGKAT